MSTLIAPTYDQINRQACPYPAFLLPKGGTGLALFAAGFHGWNDVIHMSRKQMTVTCVDTNADKLWQMAEVYPEGWEFRVDDAWDFAERAAMEGREFDVVSVDPFFGDAAEHAWETLFLWVTLARKIVTLTVKTDTKLNIPTGWTADYFPRSNSAAWLVLTR